MEGGMYAAGGDQKVGRSKFSKLTSKQKGHLASQPTYNWTFYASMLWFQLCLRFAPKMGRGTNIELSPSFWKWGLYPLVFYVPVFYDEQCYLFSEHKTEWTQNYISISHCPVIKSWVDRTSDIELDHYSWLNMLFSTILCPLYIQTNLIQFYVHVCCIF